MVLGWLSQSLELNQIEKLWRDLKQAVRAGKSSSVSELKQIWVFLQFSLHPVFKKDAGTDHESTQINLFCDGISDLEISKTDLLYFD